MTTATIGKWGNAMALRIPQPFAKQLGWEVGDAIDIGVSGNKLVVESSDEAYTLKARMQGWDGGRFETHEYDWGEPRGAEAW